MVDHCHLKHYLQIINRSCTQVSNRWHCGKGRRLIDDIADWSEEGLGFLKLRWLCFGERHFLIFEDDRLEPQKIFQNSIKECQPSEWQAKGKNKE